MEPIEYLKAIGRRWLVIVALGVIGLAAAFTYASFLPSLYKSTSSVFVASVQGETTSELVQGSTFTQNLVQSYAQLVTLPVVLDPVITTLGLDMTTPELASTVSVTTPLNTVVIEITVSSTSPNSAAETANAISESLSNAVQSLAPKGPNNAPSVAVEPVSVANVPSAPYAPNTRLILISGLAGGLLLGVLYALGREIFDTRLRAERDFQRVTDIPLLGKVRRRRAAKDGGPVLLAQPHGAEAEDYRRLRANLEFIDVDHNPRSVVITSPVSHDGKTTTAMNLALALAERTPRVLLIDADLRNPSIAEACDIDGDVGLTTVLIGAVSAEAAITSWAESLAVLPAGALPPNPAQLLASQAMSALIEKLSAEYDFIVIDSPPVLPASDALTLARLADGAIIVTRYKSTRRSQLAATLNALDAVNARIFGVVFNEVRGRGVHSYIGANTKRPPRATQPVPVAPTPAQPPELSAASVDSVGNTPSSTLIPPSA